MAVEVSPPGGANPKPGGRGFSTADRVERVAPDPGNREAVPEVSRQVPAAGAGRDPAGNAEQTVTEIRTVAQRVFRDLQFSVDQDSGEMVVEVVERISGELIRRIPATELLELGRTLNDLQVDRERASGGGLDSEVESGSSQPAGILISTKA